MGEPRRIELMPVGPLVKEKKSAKTNHSIRFNLTLAESTNRTCTEVSYVELLRNALEKRKEKKEKKEDDPNPPALDPDDPFANQDDAEHDKLLALAQSFEAKYGPKPGKKKKHLDRIQDLVDLGDGYDETDPFVDNSEAYDEIVPACLTTKLGGFYINSGVLDFREISDESDDDFQGPKKKRKKRRITSDSESEGGEEKKKRGPKRKKFKEDGEKIRKKKKKLSSSSVDGTVKKEGLGMKKKRGRPKIKNTSPTVAELLKRQTLPTSQNGMDIKSDYNGSDSMNEAEGIFSQDLGSSKIDSTINNVVQRTHSPEYEGRSTSPHPENAPKLPASVPSAMEKNIDKLKQAARDSEEGKCKFFSTAVNRILLQIELQAREIPVSARMPMYAHLAAFLPCGVQTLMKRAKKLRVNAQDDRMREPFQKLKEAISRAMPAQLERYQQDCLLAAQMRGEKNSDEKTDREPKEASTESDEEASHGTEATGKKKKTRPVKRFQWNQEIIALLCDLVSVKMEMFEMAKIRSNQSAEEYLKAYIEAEVKPLWPKGWMQTRYLFKESRTAHFAWTNAVLKPKKPLIVTSKPVTSTPVQVSQGGPGLSSSALLPGSAASSPIIAATPDASIIEEPKALNLSDAKIGSPSTPTAVAATPNLLDYASASYMSAAKSKNLPQTMLTMGTTLKTNSLTSEKCQSSNTSALLAQASASSLTVNLGAKVSSSLEAGLLGMRTPATDALKNAVSSTFSSNAGYMAQFEKFAKKFQEKTNVPATVGSSHSPTGKSGPPPRSPPTSKAATHVASVQSSLSPKAKIGSASSSHQNLSQVSSASLAGEEAKRVPKMKPIGSLGFTTSSSLTEPNTKHTSKAQLQHAQVTSSSTSKQTPGSVGQKPTANQGQLSDKSRSQALNQGQSDGVGLFSRVAQSLQSGPILNPGQHSAHGGVSSKKSLTDVVVSLSSVPTQGSNKPDGTVYRQTSPFSVGSTISTNNPIARSGSGPVVTQRTSASSAAPVYTKASTLSKSATSTAQSFAGLSPPRKVLPQSTSNSNNKSGVSSSQNSDKTLKAPRSSTTPANADMLLGVLTLDQIRERLHGPVSSTPLLSSQPSTSYSQAISQAVRPSSITSTIQSKPANQVSASQSRHTAQVSAVQSRQTAQTTSSHSRHATSAAGNHSRPASQGVSSHSHPNSQPVSTHSRQPSATSHSRAINQASSSLSSQSTVVTTASFPHVAHDNISSKMRKLMASRPLSHTNISHTSKPTVVTSSPATTKFPGLNSQAVAVDSSTSAFVVKKDTPDFKFPGRSSPAVAVDSSTSAFAAPSMVVSSSPAATSGVFLSPVNSSMSVARTYPSVQLSNVNVALDTSSHGRVTVSHNSPSMQQLLRSPDSILAPGSSLYGRINPQSAHSLPNNPSPQTLCPSMHGSSPIHVLQPTALPYGFPYTDPNHTQHRY